MPSIVTKYGPAWLYAHPVNSLVDAWCALPDNHPARVPVDTERELYGIVHASYDRGEIPVANWSGHRIPPEHMPERITESKRDERQP